MKTVKVFAAILFGVSVLLTSCQKEPEPISVTGISLDSSSLTLIEGETARLTATISPSNADNQGVIWSSSNASVASVSNGTVTAVSAGTVIITAKSDDGGKTAACNVTVNSKIVSVTGVSLDKISLELTEGDEYTLVATVQPSNATNQSISWSSSDKTIVSVDNGKVTALKPGDAVITVTTSDGNKTAKCEVTVNEKIYHVESVSLDKTSLELTEGDEATLTATIKPDNASNKQVSWKSEDETIATVSNGKVKAIKPGNAVIIVTTSDGNKTASCSIKVNEKIYHVESVTLDKTSLELTEGDEATLTATVLPENASNKNILWSSSNENVATVSNGLVKAVAPGTTSIIAKSEDGEKTATCEITVLEKEIIIQFADENVKAICVENWDTNGDGELSKKEAAAVTSIGDIFQTKTKIESFDEFKYFTGIKSLNSTAFKNCVNLHSITIPAGVDYATGFADCYNLLRVSISEGVIGIGNKAFQGCSSLISVTLPNSVSWIGSSAFDHCSSLKDINIPEKVTFIGSAAFCYCINLTSVILPEGLEKIEGATFSNCRALKSVNIPNSVTSISEMTFLECSSLTSISIPKDVTVIGGMAFQGCTSLIELYCYALTPPDIGYDALKRANKCKIYVPAESVDVYKVVNGWKEYASRIQAIE